MSKVKLKHASGNSMAIGAPPTNPASDLELKLPATIGTAGQVLGVDGSGNLTWTDVPSITQSSWTAFGTGTTTEITGISANAIEITVVGVDISAVDNSQLLRLRLGGAGGYKTSGYEVTSCEGGGSNGGQGRTAGFEQQYVGNQGYAMNIVWRLTKANSNIWNLSGYTNAGNGTETTDFRLNGTVDLGEALTKLQFDLSGSGGNAFDGGSWRIYTTAI